MAKDQRFATVWQIHEVNKLLLENDITSVKPDWERVREHEADAIITALKEPRMVVKKVFCLTDGKTTIRRQTLCLLEVIGLNQRQKELGDEFLWNAEDYSP